MKETNFIFKLSVYYTTLLKFKNALNFAHTVYLLIFFMKLIMKIDYYLK